MALFQLRLNPSRRELRLFAGLWFPALGLVAGLLTLRKLHSNSAALCIWGIGAALSLSGLWSPSIIRPVYRFLMRLTFPVGWVLSHVVLAAAYFLVLAPIGQIMRVWHDPMQRELLRSTDSYWIPRASSETSRYLRQT